MLPASARLNAGYCRLPDAVPLGENVGRLRRSNYCPSLRLGEFVICPPITTDEVPALAEFIEHVLTRRSEKQMVRIHTLFVIAGVADVHSRRDAALKD